MGAPEGILLERHLRLGGRRRASLVRRGSLALLALVPVLALLNVFGQRPQIDHVQSAAADLEVYSPSRLRGGLLFTTRFTLAARRTLRNPALVLAPGWIEGMQVNSVTPQPREERSRDGHLVFELDDILAGHRAVYFVEFQVNPTNVGRRTESVRLEAEGQRPLTIERTVTIFP
jgi:hypothetical protein